ncbi:transcriptional regulator [Chryseobacterium pennae]|uniref:Transcriptional regulator n=1 Tax=Chryseobacterium pennae TaxID=2258962 RepID=A0A3D9CE90_9FLAO|nr:helix-turn-helix transcriptional regulator [Chryseobacterium pennae]REC64089.1 transcriptional regulator [Chryseobacterium pennae]
MQKEKLRTLRKKKGFTQQQIANIIATDVSNYSRKETGDVRIYKEEWEKIARFLEVPVDEIYEEEEVRVIVENPVFNDSPGSSAGGNVTNFTNKENTSIIKNLQDYISLLKEENQRLKEKLNKYEK